MFRKGPIFTPGSLANADDGTSGTLMLPSFTGGANWEGGSFDPETNTLYIGSYTQPSIAVLHPEPRVLGHARTSQVAVRRCRGSTGFRSSSRPMAASRPST